MSRGVDGGLSTRLKFLASVGAVSLAVALLQVASNPIAADYEISVYDAYGQSFWLFVLVAVFVGQLIIFESGNSDEAHRYWKWGLTLVVAANLVILLVPALRYHLWARGDMLTYIGMMRQIDTLGVVPRSNYYPNLHLLGVAFSYATGIEFTKVINIVPPLVSVFYIFSTYVLLKVLFSDSRKVLVALSFTSLLLLGGDHYWFHPSAVAFMLLPFVFYLLFRGYDTSSSYRFQLPLLVAVFSLTFYHPAVTVFFIGMLGILKVALFAGRRVSTGLRSRETTSVIAGTIAFVVFFSWYYSFESFIGSTFIIIYTVIGISESSSTFGDVTSVLGRTNPDLADIAIVGIYTYGFIGAIIGVGFVFFSYFAYLTLRGEREFDAVEAFLGGTLLVFTVGGSAAFFVDVTLGMSRVIRYARFAGALLIGVGFYTLFERSNSKLVSRYVRPLVYLSFFVFAFFSVYGLYGSPLDNSTNNQITEAEVVGMEWLFENRNRSLLIDQLGINQYRMYSFSESRVERGENVRWRAPPPPEHFEYGNVSSESVSDGAAESRRYLVTTRMGRITNPSLYPEYPQYWRHTPADFARLQYNSSFSHVYDDGTLDTYIVRGVERRANDSAVDSRSDSNAGPPTQAIHVPKRTTRSERDATTDPPFFTNRVVEPDVTGRDRRSSTGALRTPSTAGQAWNEPRQAWNKRNVLRQAWNERDAPRADVAR